MPQGADVRPKRWSRVIDLYDDGEYSAIWGSLDEDDQRILGVRWNGITDDEPYGYPSLGGNPVWYVERHFLIRPILRTLLEELARNRSQPRADEYINNLLIALSESE